MNSKRRFITVLAITLLVFLAIFSLSNAAPPKQKTYMPLIFQTTRHFNDCAFRTGTNATIAVPADVQINGSLDLDIDDEIAVFTPDGSVCAGMEPWSGQSIAVTVWGDNSQTPERDGLREGETMMFRIWDNSENKEIEVKRTIYSLGSPTYKVNGIYIVKTFSLN